MEFSEHLQVLLQLAEVLNGGPPLAEVVMIKSTVETHPGHKGALRCRTLVRPRMVVLLYFRVKNTPFPVWERSVRKRRHKHSCGFKECSGQVCWVSCVRCRPTDGQHGKVRRLRVSEPQREQREPGHFQQTTKEVL